VAGVLAENTPIFMTITGNCPHQVLRALVNGFEAPGRGVCSPQFELSGRNQLMISTSVSSFLLSSFLSNLFYL
jgi:hypothetical protein